MTDWHDIGSLHFFPSALIDTRLPLFCLCKMDCFPTLPDFHVAFSLLSFFPTWLCYSGSRQPSSSFISHSVDPISLFFYVSLGVAPCYRRSRYLEHEMCEVSFFLLIFFLFRGVAVASNFWCNVCGGGTTSFYLQVYGSAANYKYVVEYGTTVTGITIVMVLKMCSALATASEYRNPVVKI